MRSAMYTRPESKARLWAGRALLAVPVVFLVPEAAEVAVGVFQAIQSLRPGRIAGHGLGMAGTPETAQAVDDDAAQPAAKGPAAQVVLEARQLAQQGAEHFLRQVVVVGHRHSCASQPRAKEWVVDIDQVAPVGVRRFPG